MNVNITLNLLVLRVSDLERAKMFYEALGISFTPERHGNGPEHFSAQLGGCVLELYPIGTGKPTAGLRLGLAVSDFASAMLGLRKLGATAVVEPVPSSSGDRAVVADPDGHKIELSQIGVSEI